MLKSFILSAAFLATTTTAQLTGLNALSTPAAPTIVSTATMAATASCPVLQPGMTYPVGFEHCNTVAASCPPIQPGMSYPRQFINCVPCPTINPDGTVMIDLKATCTPTVTVAPNTNADVSATPSPVYEFTMVTPKPCGDWYCPNNLPMVLYGGQYYCVDSYTPIAREVCDDVDADGNCLRYVVTYVCENNDILYNDKCHTLTRPMWRDCPSSSPTVTPKAAQVSREIPSVSVTSSVTGSVTGSVTPKAAEISRDVPSVSVTGSMTPKAAEISRDVPSRSATMTPRGIDTSLPPSSSSTPKAAEVSRDVPSSSVTPKAAEVSRDVPSSSSTPKAAEVSRDVPSVSVTSSVTPNAAEVSRDVPSVSVTSSVTPKAAQVSRDVPSSTVTASVTPEQAETTAVQITKEEAPSKTPKVEPSPAADVTKDPEPSVVRPSPSSSPCLRWICPDGSTLIKDRLCEWVLPVGKYFTCEKGDILLANHNCTSIYNNYDASVPCKKGYEAVYTSSNVMVCTMLYPALLSPCPMNYDLDTSQSDAIQRCVRYSEARCNNVPPSPSMTPYPSRKPRTSVQFVTFKPKPSIIRFSPRPIPKDQLSLTFAAVDPQTIVDTAAELKDILATMHGVPVDYIVIKGVKRVIKNIIYNFNVTDVITRVGGAVRRLQQIPDQTTITYDVTGNTGASVTADISPLLDSYIQSVVDPAIVQQYLGNVSVSDLTHMLYTMAAGLSAAMTSQPAVASENNMSIGGIAGIVIGAAAFAAIVSALVATHISNARNRAANAKMLTAVKVINNNGTGQPQVVKNNAFGVNEYPPSAV